MDVAAAAPCQFVLSGSSRVNAESNTGWRRRDGWVKSPLVTRGNSEWRRWLREPLLHFVLLGTAVFAVYAVIKDRPLDPLTDADAPVEQLVRDWQTRTGAPPTDAERARLVREWLEEEALYRRALELGLDQSDTVVRRRLIQRMRFLVEDTTPVPEPEDAELRAWIADHVADYSEPARISFEHRFFSRGKRGTHLAADAEAAAEELMASPDASIEADSFPRGEAVREQTPASIARSFGTAFADRLLELPVGRWSGPIESSYGLHVVRLTARIEAAPPSLEAVRERARADWMYVERKHRNQQAVDRLIERYAVKGEDLP